MEPFECSLLAFAPFTIDFGDGHVFDYSSGINNESNYGTSQTASALLAVDHFNSRDSSVVPELTELLQDCDVTLRLGNESIIDTGALVGRASQRFYENPLDRPCAMVGPFNDYPSIEMSMMATAIQVPIVTSRGFNLRLVSNFISPFTTTIYPDIHASAKATISYLQSIGRTDFYCFLYGIDETNLQRSETLALLFDEAQPKVISHFPSPFGHAVGFEGLESRSIHTALKAIKQKGYRTILVAPTAGWDFEEMAAAAEEVGMNDGSYVWCFLDEIPVADFTNKNVTKLLDGSASIVPITGSELEQESDPFQRAWRSQGSPEVDRLNLLNPINQDDPGYRFANGSDYFQRVPPEYGSNFIYDAVMSVGIGACSAQRHGKKIAGLEFVDSIRNASFTGATGKVVFGSGSDAGFDRLGARLASTVSWVALNIRASKVVEFVPTGVLFPGPNRTWEKTEFEFVYRNGSTSAPLPRDIPEQNHIPSYLRVIGMTLMGLSMVTTLLCAMWIYKYRKHRVILASQPFFLYLICLGTFIQSSAIVSISFDEGAGWTTRQLDGACQATPWLLVLGFVIIYGSLWTKMSRVNSILQFQRRQLQIGRVVRPMIVFVILAVVVLIVWTVTDPLVWSRTFVDDESAGESIGVCDCDNFAAFMTPLTVLCAIPAGMTALFAWKTRDVDDSYTESFWTLILILVQLEVMIIAAPIIVILRDLSTEGRYIGFVLMLWIFPMSTISIILFPKYVHFLRVERGLDLSGRPKRGERVGIKVSGAPAPSSGAIQTTSSPVSHVAAHSSELSAPPVLVENNGELVAMKLSENDP